MASRAPKIALVSYFYPPANDVAAGRVFHFANGLARNGLECDVYTVDKSPYLFKNVGYKLDAEPGVQVREVSFPLKVIWAKGFFNGRFFGQGSYRALMQLTKLLLQFIWCFKVWRCMHSRAEYDIVLTSYGPSTCSIIGRLIKQTSPNSLWVHDYRDLWSQQSAIQNLSSYQQWIQLQHRWIERWCVSKANILTVVSDGLAETLGEWEKETHVVYNGFEGAINEVSPFNSPGTAKMLYTGIFYRGYRDASEMIEVLKLIDNSCALVGRLDVEIIGTFETFEDDRKKVTEYALENVVSFGKKISRGECLIKQREADYLLFFDWRDENEKGMLSGKIFEYLASGKPILCFDSHEDSPVKKLIQETKTGFVMSRDASVCAEQLENILSGRDQQWFDPQYDIIEQYSRANQSDRFYQIIASAGRTV